MMLEVALTHAAAGRRVFPADPNSKRPLIEGWQELASTDAERIRAWWDWRPDAMPGWALPPTVAVVDADPRNGASADTCPGDLPTTRTASTAGGGAHFFYAVPPDRPVKNGKIRDGWDCKTAGGYVVLDGAVRADGNAYELSRDLPIAPAPEWLLVAKARTSSDAPSVHRVPVIWEVGHELESTMAPGVVALLSPLLAVRGSRHEVARAIGGALGVAGWTDDGIAGVVRALPSDDPGARVADALGAAARARAGDPAPQWGSLERAGYAPAIVSAIRTMAGGGALETLEAETVAHRAEAASDAPPRAAVIRVADVYAKIDPVPWLCEGLRIAPGAPTIVAGYGGVGKSMLVQLLIVCIATGVPFLGNPVKRGRVRHYDYEQGKRITVARYQRLAAALGVGAGALAEGLEIVPAPDFRLTDPAARERLVKECEGHTLAVFDALRGAVGRELDENDSRIREPLDMLLGVSEATGCTMLPLHHARKASKENAGGGNQNMRGSSAINDASQTVIMLEPASHGFNVECGKLRDGSPFTPFGVSIVDVPLDRDDVNFPGLRLEVVDGLAREKADRQARLSEDCSTVLAYGRSQPGGRLPGRAAIAEATGLSERRVRGALETLEHNRKVITDSTGRHAVCP